jgi:hypothetical protein
VTKRALNQHRSGKQLTARKAEQAVIDAFWIAASDRAKRKKPRPAEKIAREVVHRHLPARQRYS